MTPPELPYVTLLPCAGREAGRWMVVVMRYDTVQDSYLPREMGPPEALARAQMRADAWAVEHGVDVR